MSVELLRSFPDPTLLDVVFIAQWVVVGVAGLALGLLVVASIVGGVIIAYVMAIEHSHYVIIWALRLVKGKSHET